MNKIILVIVIIVIGILFLNKSNIKDENDSIKTVAFVALSHVDDNTFDGFKKQMSQYGWEDGKNIQYIIPGAAHTKTKLPSIISSVIQKKPDVILVSSTPATQETKKQIAGTNMPIVFCPVNDPVGSNIVSNTNMPEGSITGVRLPIGDAKRFEWLHEIVPNAKNILIPYTPKDGAAIASRKYIKQISDTLNINIIEQPFLEDVTVEQFFKDTPKNYDAIFLPRDSRVEVRIEKISKYAIEHKLPLSAPSYQQVQKGALFTFGFIHKELGKQAAKMVDRLLKGVKPADLPVKFGNAYLVINKKTAKAIGIQFSQNAIKNAKLIIEE